MSHDLHHLGKNSNQPIDTVDLIPWTGGAITVRLECADFTSLCPVTGHPDFATLEIEYLPDRYLVETKSLKLYLWRYRDQRTFNEHLVDEIATGLNDQIQPLWLRVIGRFHPRGGIAVTVNAERGDRTAERRGRPAEREDRAARREDRAAEREDRAARREDRAADAPPVR